MSEKEAQGEQVGWRGRGRESDKVGREDMREGREIDRARARARAGENEREKDKEAEREKGREGRTEGESERARKSLGVQEGGGNERGEGMSKRQEERAEREEARPLAWGIVSGERSRPAVGVVGVVCVWLCGCAWSGSQKSNETA